MSHNRIKRNISGLMALLLCLVLVLSAVPAAYAAEGTCGSELSWSFDGSTLAITGSGHMTNYSADNLPPWYEFRHQVRQISLPEGLTRIGDLAFYECVNLASVRIPATVSVIGEAAFFRNSSLTALVLNEGLRSIGRKAFSECTALADLRLPESVIMVDNYAFSMCRSLSYVTIPAYVKEFGDGVFSYCENLLRVDVNAAVALPSWSFYGCNQLQVVTVQGKAEDPRDYMKPNYPGEAPGESLPDGSGEETPGTIPGTTPGTTPMPVTPAPEAGYVSGESTTTDQNGNTVVDKTTVTQTENATTVIVERAPADQPENVTTIITSTLQNDQGWNDVLDKVGSATIGGNTKPVDVTVYVPNNDTVPPGVLDYLAGKNVSLTVQTQSGSRFTLDCTKLEGDNKNPLALNYVLVPMTDVPESLQGCTVYQLRFLSAVKLSAQLVIRLPGGHAMSTATLYQMKGKKLQKLQSVIVDPDGDAHWYVGAVDEKTEYLIAINAPGAAEDSPIIPPALHDVYKVENVYDGVEYIITGRESSWGVGLGTVMGILAAVMVGVVAVVGGVLWFWNKKRIRSGYVAGWDDDDEE